MKLLSLLLLMLTGVAGAQPVTPVIFVHGNGDDATKWVPTMWLFESNGYPRERLFAIRLTDPVARRDNSKFEAFRSSTTDQAAELAGYVARVLLETKAHKVALVGSSRGGLTMRNYLRNAGGAAVVSHAVLCGTPNHGVMNLDTAPEQEFNGKGRFLQALNQGKEVVDGVRFLTIRSDKLDKYAQANVGYDAPALAGAENVLLPGLDHREVAFHPQAFAVMYRFLTGQEPRHLKPVPEPAPTVSGLITGFTNGAPTNRPQAGVRFSVYALQTGSAGRDGGPVYERTTDESGEWGPVQVQPERGYEFVLEAGGRRVTYFMAGLVRSAGLLNFRLVPQAAAGLQVHRPQGYLAKGRDALKVDGQEWEALPEGVPTRDAVPLAVDRPVQIQLRSETIYARPALKENETNIAELLWE